MTTKSDFFANHAFRFRLKVEGDDLAEIKPVSVKRPLEAEAETDEFYEELESIEIKNNECRAETGRFLPSEWGEHTDEMNLARFVKNSVQQRCGPNLPPLLTNAWLKFYEILNNFDLLESVVDRDVKGLYLCEAPGAFINATYHFLQSNPQTQEWSFDFRANTLNPFYEGYGRKNNDTIDDRFICNPKIFSKWFFGASNMGDILEMGFKSELAKFIRDDFDCDDARLFDLVTGDGAFDCSINFAQQETIVLPLIKRECEFGLTFLKNGGSMVIKFFTFFRHETVALLYDLWVLFKRVDVFKPLTSKAGNSEVYLVFQDFDLSVYEEKRSQLFKNSFEIPESFRQKILSCVRTLSNRQQSTIMNNKKEFGSFTQQYKQLLEDSQREVAAQWVQVCDIRPIDAPLVEQFVKPRLHHPKPNILGRVFAVYERTQSYEMFVYDVVNDMLLKYPKKLWRATNMLTGLDPSVDICIRFGMPFKKILNDKLCYYNSMRIYSIIEEHSSTYELLYDDYNYFKTPEEAVNYYVDSNNFRLEDEKLLPRNLHYFDVYQYQDGEFFDNDQKAVLELKKYLENSVKFFKKNHSVMFRFKNILSRSMVSLLFLVSRGFCEFYKDLQFTRRDNENSLINPHIDVYVILKNFRGFPPPVASVLTASIEKSIEKQSRELYQSVMEFVSVPDMLTDPDFFANIHAINTLALFFHIKYRLGLNLNISPRFDFWGNSLEISTHLEMMSTLAGGGGASGGACFQSS